MLTLQKKQNKNILSIETENQSIDNLLNKEWLLTNGRGGYASSTIAGCNTRSYHGLLVGTLDPPVQKVMALSNCLEMIISEGKVFNFSTFEFAAGSPEDNDKFAPDGYKFLKHFHKDTGVHYYYELENFKITRSIYLLRNQDTAVIVYDFKSIPRTVEFVCRPLIGLRDFHSIQKSYAHFCSNPTENGVSIRHDTPNSCELFLNCPTTNFIKDPQWWFNFTYRDNKERGQNYTEDLWTPGFFKYRIRTPEKVVLWASLFPPENGSNSRPVIISNIQLARKNLKKHNENILSKIHNKPSSNLLPAQDQYEKLFSYYETLCLAADQFIVKRKEQNSFQTTIIAGYPWFADWGRDAFISLPGLLLCTDRFDEAKSVLTTFASALDEGMIPARFDDNENTACFNSVDASLWFINAAFKYLQVSNDSATFNKELLPTIHKIIDAYEKGTRFDIHADVDGLIMAGNEKTQLTWMDAKYDGLAFTPRFGKAVEVNSLWYNSLCYLANFYSEHDSARANCFQSKADQVKEAFCTLFWNSEKNYLNDCIFPDGSIDDSLRPNQLYAISLDYSPLNHDQQNSVVNAVKENLLTPYGLRTLNSSADKYKGLYTGPQSQRDEAYHQGTVWAYLIGPFIESFLKVNNFNDESKKASSEMIQPLLKHLIEDGCLGSVSEIFDGDAPHKPKGCFAQAWSVAELLRAYRMIYC